MIADYWRLKREIAPTMLYELRGGLSYGKMALQLGCERSYLHKIEHRAEVISDELLLKLIEMREK